MIEIIKFGSVPKTYRITCDNCKCVFNFQDEDINIDYCDFVCCPMCHKELYLEPNRKFFIIKGDTYGTTS